MDLSKIVIFTEHPKLTENYVRNKFNCLPYCVEVYGNTEQFIRDGYADMGTVVCDSGKTINEIIYTSQMNCITNFSIFQRIS